MTDKSTPLVSILIPTYNGEKYIGETLESVLKQSYQNWEAIIMDDGSIDGTLDIVRQFDDPRIRLFDKNENVGAKANWDRGLLEVRGEYFKLLPQDDLLSSDCLAEQVKILLNDTTQAIALVFSSRQIIGPNGDRRMIRGFGSKGSGIIPAKVIINHCIRAGGNLIGEPGSGLMRSSLMRRLNGYSASFPYVIDMDFWFRALEHGDGFYLAKPLTFFRVSLSAWSVRLGKKQFDDYRGLAEQVYAQQKFGLSYWGLKQGVARAKLNAWLRFLYYKFFI